MPFQKGQSGNPHGRKPGNRNRATLAVESLMEGQAEALSRKAVELALEGNLLALRLCLDRVAPVRKGRAVSIEMKSVVTLQDLAAAHLQIVNAMGCGLLSPEEAVAAATALDRAGCALERQELEERVRALELKETMS
jgi:hypothetical protein